MEIHRAAGNFKSVARLQSGVIAFETSLRDPFASVAEILVTKGWSVFPQTPDSSRRPGTVKHVTINWDTEHHLVTQLPTPAALASWIKHCASLNCACVMGPGSGYAIALDLDIDDPALCVRAEALADEILGSTRLRRHGRAPRVARLYRRLPQESIPNLSRKAREGGHGLDVLSDGKVLTFYGWHHKTSKGFTWPDAHPMDLGPGDVPEISATQIETYLASLDEIMPFAQGHGLRGDAAFGVDASWLEDADGRITDGRETYITTLTDRYVRARVNQGLSLGDEAVRDIAQEVVREFLHTAVADGRWAPEHLPLEATSRARRFLARAREGRLSTVSAKTWSLAPAAGARPEQDARPEIESPSSQSSTQEKPETPALLQGSDPWSTRGVRKVVAKLTPPVAPAPSRGVPSLEPVVAQLRDTIGEFLDECHGKARQRGVARDDPPSLVLLKAPPGMGKTSTTLDMIASAPETYLDLPDAAGKPIRAPFVMLVPTYRNVEELRERALLFNLDPSASDETFRAAAQARGLMQEKDAPDRLDALRSAVARVGGQAATDGREFIVGVYKGKTRAGCQMKEEMELALSGGYGASSLCSKDEIVRGNDHKPKRGDDGKSLKNTLRCHFYDGCPAIEQRKVFDEAHLVLMPHAFLALSIPQVAQSVRGVIIDERAHDLFLHMRIFPVSHLSVPRRAPKLSKRDIEDGIQPEDYLAGRAEAVAIALEALRRCEDVATAFADHEAGSIFLAQAKRCATVSSQRDSQLQPNMTLQQIKDVIAAPTGLGALEEKKFWELVEERCTTVLAHRAATGLGLQQDDVNSAPPPRGQRDARIRLHRTPAGPDGRKGPEMIRISWRSNPNWNDAPIMILDASAAPAIVAKVWGRDKAATYEVDLTAQAGLWDRLKVVYVGDGTHSNRQIAAESGCGIKDKIMAGESLAQVRQALTALSLVHGDTRIVAGGSILARKLINQLWAGPTNIDWCHYGALRGIDAFRQHGAAASIGRMELPIEALDGLAAALAYDDPEPEEPFDARGTGRDPADESQPLMLPMVDRTHAMRDGGRLTLKVPEHPGFWGGLLQRQYREEELIQFLGRLRPFHRQGPQPTWYAISSVMPENTVVDRIIHISDVSLTSRGGDVGCDIIRQGRGRGGRATASCLAPPVLADDAAFFLKRIGIDLDEKGYASSAMQAATELRSSDGGETEVVLRVLDKRGSVLTPPPDALDEAIGDWDTRRRREIALMKNIATLTGHDSPIWTRGELIGKRPIPNTLTVRKVPLPVLAALAAIETYWAQDGLARIDAALATSQDDDETFRYATATGAAGVDYARFGAAPGPREHDDSYVSESFAQRSGQLGAGRGPAAQVVPPPFHHVGLRNGALMEQAPGRGQGDQAALDSRHQNQKGQHDLSPALQPAQSYRPEFRLFRQG